MMKNILYKFVLGLSAIMLTFCGEPDLPYDEVTIQNNNGAFLRVVEVTSPTFDLFDIENSPFEITLDAFDNQDGDLIENVVFTVDHIDNTLVGGDTTITERVEVLTVPASEFSMNDDSGLPRVNVSISAAETLAALGITATDIDGTDRFSFKWTLNLTNGDSYNEDNSSNSVAGETFYSSTFSSNVNVICGIADDAFTGTYTYEPLGAGPFGVAPFGDNQQTVEVFSNGGTSRFVSLDYLPQFVPGNPFDFTFDVVCSSVIPEDNQPTGVGCGAAILIGSPSAADFGTVDPTNEDEIIVTILDMQVDGNCGADPVPVSFRLFR